MIDGELPVYPQGPGFKEETTSREAAEAVAPTTPRLRTLVLSCLNRRGPMTADECAAVMNMDILSIRPRFSELKRLGAIEKTGERRPNRSSSLAHVWRPKPQAVALP